MFLYWEEDKDITFKFKVNVHVRKIRVTTKRIEIECITSKLVKGGKGK